jgi:hypothetical protein
MCNAVIMIIYCSNLLLKFLRALIELISTEREQIIAPSFQVVIQALCEKYLWRLNVPSCQYFLVHTGPIYWDP